MTPDERRARIAEALTVGLANDLCAAGHDNDPDRHCQECYDIACTVFDSPTFAWLADRAKVAAAVEAVLAECERRIGREPDRVLEFWVQRVRAALADPAAAVARIKAEAGCEQRSGDGTHEPLIRQAKAEARKQALRESANEVHIEARFQTELMVRQGPEPHRYLTDRLSILETILRDRADRIGGGA